MTKSVGYKDAGSDIAYNLAHSGSENDRVKVLTPVDSPDPASVEDWTFPDTESGMLEAIEKGATILWAKTNLFASHPIQTSRRLDQYADRVSVVGQPPNLCDQLDDKRLLNDYLRRQGSFVLPRAWVISAEQDYNTLLRRGEIPLPVVGKPIRGRGSHGVKVCFTLEALHQHVEDLLAESPIMMLEEYLTGEEGTICVMPPTAENPDYSALSFVRRTDHQDEVIPYTGKVAAVLNSRALTLSELAEDPEYKIAMDQCEAVGRLIKTTAPIRIDVRRFDQIQNTKFALFDINLKPVRLSEIPAKL